MKLLKFLKNNVIKFPKKVAIKYANKKIFYIDFWKNIKIYYYFFKFNKIKKLIIIENDCENEFCYIAIFACLLSKTTYIPISLNTPRLRIQEIINTVKPCAVLSIKKILNNNTTNINPEIILKKKKIIKKNNNVSLSEIAYVIFTSGSTGKPKGVCISRKALDHYVLWLKKNIFTNKSFKIPQFSRIGFDLSVVDIFGALCSGSTLYPLKNEFDRNFINKFISKNKINFWISVPSSVEMFNSKKDLVTIKKIFFCGEPLKRSHLKKIFKINNKIIVYNTYGPTEATVSCSILKLTKNNFLKFCNPNASFGVPINDISFQFEKEFKHNKKSNNMGELLISGPQLASCYFNNNELTNDKFVIKNGKRFYKTGDICKKINKNYYFINRDDNQVKINGYRIELEEIDNKINELFNISSYSFIRLNKIYTCINKHNLEKKIKLKLIKYLPSYMIPFKILYVKSWPRNKNFKIDINKIKLINNND